MKKYWHELTRDERDLLIASGIKVGELLEKYNQPDWCGYPDAIAGNLGCWSLFYHPEKVNKDYCSTCDCFITG